MATFNELEDISFRILHVAFTYASSSATIQTHPAAPCLPPVPPPAPAPTPLPDPLPAEPPPPCDHVVLVVSTISLRTDGSVCARNGEVCSDAPGSGVAPSPTPTPAPSPGPTGPVDCLAECPEDPSANCAGTDVTRDGMVTVDDLLTMLSQYGRTC